MVIPQIDRQGVYSFHGGVEMGEGVNILHPNLPQSSTDCLLLFLKQHFTFHVDLWYIFFWQGGRGGERQIF